ERGTRGGAGNQRRADPGRGPRGPGTPPDGAGEGGRIVGDYAGNPGRSGAVHRAGEAGTSPGGSWPDGGRADVGGRDRRRENPGRRPGRIGRLLESSTRMRAITEGLQG